MTDSKDVPPAKVVGMELDVSIIAGQDLAVKDSSLFGRGSSDPYVTCSLGTTKPKPITYHKTKTILKNLSPTWNEHFKVTLSEAQSQHGLVFSIFDWDKLSKDDPMGEVKVSLKDRADGSVLDEWLVVQPSAGSGKVSGKIHLKITFSLKRSVNLSAPSKIDMAASSSMNIAGGVLAVGLGWTPIGSTPVDLDLSVVGVSRQGQVLMDETVYFGDLSNSNGSIRHSGDEKTGEEDLGQGDDEVVMIDLDKVPDKVLALVVIATCASPQFNLGDVKNACLRLVGCEFGMELCRYYPAIAGTHTAFFMVRLSRMPDSREGWKLTIIGTSDPSARDFGSLIPEIKTLMYDLVPTIKVDPNERVCLLRKGGLVRLRDYCGLEGIPTRLTMGLAWDVTGGVDIDLDASCLLMDAERKVLDTIFFGHLKASNQSVIHSGDERSGGASGDDEKITIQLGRLAPEVAYLGFTINSYSGQELDDIASCSCHVFDPVTNRDLCKYKLSGTKELDKKTALLVAILYRDGGTAEWVLQIVAQPAMGKTVQNLEKVLQEFLIKHNPLPLGPSRPIAAAAGFMMSNTQGGVKPTMMVSVPPGMHAGMQLVVNGPKGPIWCTIPEGCVEGQAFPVEIA
jgi:tellurium resistance protein TerZ